jgi:hypothetical protein
MTDDLCRRKRSTRVGSAKSTKFAKRGARRFELHVLAEIVTCRKAAVHAEFASAGRPRRGVQVGGTA